MNSSENVEEDRPQFSIYRVYTDGTEETWRGFKVEPAVLLAMRLTSLVTAIAVERIIINDGNGLTVWEWVPAKGITYPPELKGLLKYPSTRRDGV